LKKDREVQHSDVCVDLAEIFEKRKEDPGSLLIGAVMTELGMSSGSATSPSSEQRPRNG
jgi:hypothetical protein